MAQNSNSEQLINPFPGLRPYAVEDSRFYFSYSYRTDEVLSRLRSNRFLTLSGERGSGKASLVHCGVIPALQKGFAGKGGSHWNYISFRPGTNPLKNFALALANAKVFLEGGKIELSFADQLEEMLLENVHGLLSIFDKYTLQEEHNLLIFIDDFEDVLAHQELYENPADIFHFLNIILKFIRRSNHPVYLLMSLSSDFLSESSRYPGLPEVINDSQYMIPKMDTTHLRDIIAHACRAARIPVDQQVFVVIQQDFQQLNPNNYQIQFLLRKMTDLWIAAGSGRGVLDMKYYEKAGGLERSIEISAENIYGRLTKTQKSICSSLFRTISRGSESGRTQAVQVEHVSAAAQASVDEVIQVINAFSFEKLDLIEVIQSYDVEERLDSLDDLLNHPFSPVNRYSKITLRNTELAESWQRLEHWREEEKKAADIYMRLATAASLYQQNKKGFYTNPELETALNWYKRENPGDAWANYYAPGYHEAIEYLLASEQNHREHLRQERLRQEHKVKRDKQVKWLLIAGVVLSLTLAGWAYKERLYEMELQAELTIKSSKLGYIQNLDSMRVMYIQALHNMDSAHIDRLRYKVRELHDRRGSNMADLMAFTEGMIRQDSLCKKGIKAEISKIQNALSTWSDQWDRMHMNSDSLETADREMVENFCEILKGHCPQQLQHLTEAGSKCGF